MRKWFNATFLKFCSDKETNYINFGWPEGEYIVSKISFFGWTILFKDASYSTYLRLCNGLKGTFKLLNRFSYVSRMDKIRLACDENDFTHWAFLQCPPQVCQVADRTPHFSDETLVGDVKAAEVKDVIDGFHLLHLQHPRVRRLRCLMQDLLQVILSAVQNLMRKHRFINFLVMT